MTDDPLAPGDPVPARGDPAPVTGDPVPAPGDRADESPTSAYSPPPERRPDWATPWSAPRQPAFDDEAAPTEPVAAAPVVVGGGPRSSRSSLGTILGAALLSAALASAGTVAVLEGTGAIGPRAAATNAPANATESRQPVNIDESSAVIDAAAKVNPAVVRITASGTTTDPLGGTIPDSGIGSGIIFDQAGWIITNRHVVRTADGSIATQLLVELKDGRQFNGTVYGIDTLTDLAIVRVDATGLPTAPIGNSSDLKVGELAIAIGSPLGTYSNSVTSGIVSATGRSVVVETNVRLNNLIQTDAAINPGNSGGPLLDAAGNVIGINTAVASGSNGIGFAIPIDIARPIMSQALAGQKLERPYIGVRFEAIDLQLKISKNLPVAEGALIGPGTDANGGTLPAIAPGSPADTAGMKSGDIITGIEDKTIDAEHPLDAVLAEFAPGQTITVHLLRDGKTLDLQVTLGTRPANL
jgi:S1-C subfamily serine protease